MARAPKNPTTLNMRPVWADISVPALVHNFESIRSYVNPRNEKRRTPRQVLCIVKGNAYGHGGPEVTKALDKAGVRKPILVLTSFVPGEEQRLLEHNLTAVIHRCEQLSQLENVAARRGKKKVSFHLKIDSGMNRLGIAPASVDCFARQLAKSRHLQLSGVMTHFASSEAFSDTVAGRQTREQEERFFAALERLRALGIDPGIIHLANSAAIVTRPETWADMVRPGAILYGYHPGYEPVERRLEIEKRLPLEPVMSLRTRIISLRDVPAGTGGGYGSSL